MTLREARNRLFGQGRLTWLLGPAALALGSLCAVPALSAPLPPPAPPAPMSVVQVPPAVEETPGALSADAAIRWALEHNPEIAALRQQRGIAAAGIVIARTYPFNPVWDGTVNGASGPESAGVTNVVPITSKLTLEWELRGQRRIREQGAVATLTRTEWEVAGQELTLAVRVLRAFDNVVYRFRKRRLVLDTIELNTTVAKKLEDLAKGPMPPTAADVHLIHSEVDDARAQLPPASAALVTAWQDLYKALGLTCGAFDLLGGFEVPPRLEGDAEQLQQAAQEHRPDLRAHQVAVAEADTRVRLEIANRHGNPAIGPYFEYTEGRAAFVGVAITTPIPILNTHRGEIQQRQAERTRAALELRQNEVTVQQDVRAALARLEQARRWVDLYRRETIPNLERTLKAIQTLYQAGGPGAPDLLRVLDVQRKLLKARDVELDAIFELRQAVADLAAATGDPSVAVLPCANR
jgi:outer membrane protein TolC